ncbi:MAG: hypothetical protein V7K27_02420, partial [Nostoc sp.]|uniref:hypothetical protein n=1 Tax=Nostoc sp. TaxID=1180 RepID=UPI002FFB302B
MSASGQALISSLSNISNCSGHQCDCCASLEAKIDNLQSQIHLVNERCAAIEINAGVLLERIERLQQQIDLLIAIDLVAALFALILPEIIAAAGPVIAGIIGNAVPAAIAAAMLGALKEISEAVGAGSAEIGAVGSSAKEGVEGLASSAEGTLEGLARSGESAVEAAARSAESAVQSVASSAETELKSAAATAETELKSVATTAETELKSAA